MTESRQIRWQRRRIEGGRCRSCGKEREHSRRSKTLCLACAKAAVERITAARKRKAANP